MIDTDIILALCAVMAGALASLAIGWHFGVKAAYAAVRQIARGNLNDAEYGEFVRLLDKGTKGKAA
jgi:hypothetical protein